MKESSKGYRGIYSGIMEKKMETTILRQFVETPCLCGFSIWSTLYIVAPSSAVPTLQGSRPLYLSWGEEVTA